MNKKGHACRQAGFTLIEMVIVIGVIGIIMAAVTGVLIDTFKANNRTRLNDVVFKNGNWTLSELRKNILESGGSQIVCSIGIGDSLSVVNLNDGQETKIVCYEDGGIASESASRTVNLTSDTEVKVTGCETFAICENSPSSPTVSNVNFKFSLGAGVEGNTVENYAEKEFNLKVTVRN